MSNPRTKRPFAGAASDPSQRQITSFFTKSSSAGNSNSGNNAPSQPGPLNGPVLPVAVQSNLLSVGMRVRKSVVEGYKTSTPESAFALWSDTTPARPSTASARELAPFCGIHKVGGLAVQPVPVSSSSFAPSPPSSQESVSSTTSAADAIERSRASTTRKRFFVAEDDDVDESGSIPAAHGGPWRRRDEWIDGEISPRSFAPAGWGNARIMAVPRSRKGRASPVGGLAELDQENMAVDTDDFEEAAFLNMEME